MAPWVLLAGPEGLMHLGEEREKDKKSSIMRNSFFLGIGEKMFQCVDDSNRSAQPDLIYLAHYLPICFRFPSF